jgi:hypothetical protein
VERKRVRERRGGEGGERGRERRERGERGEIEERGEREEYRGWTYQKAHKIYSKPINIKNGRGNEHTNKGCTGSSQNQHSKYQIVINYYKLLIIIAAIINHK